jgi:DNA-binding GntR family transcriptional regulator
MFIRSLKDRVYLYIQSQIVSGNIKPGERVWEKEICSKLNISRTPVREALMKLEAEKFIQIIPHRGFIVRELTLKEIQEIYDVVGCLEGRAAAKTVATLDSQQLETLNGTMEEMRKALGINDLKEFNKQNLKFHDVYIRAFGNNLICEIIALLKKRFYEHSVKLRMLPEWEKKTMAEHEKILELINKRDAESLERFIREVHWGFQEHLPYIKKAYSFNGANSK